MHPLIIRSVNRGLDVAYLSRTELTSLSHTITLDNMFLHFEKYRSFINSSTD